MSLAAALAVTIVGTVADRSGVASTAAVATLALAVTLVAILRGDLPINLQMATWSATGLPADWQEVRARWERFFAVRVATTLIAAGALAVAVLLAD